MFFYLFNFSAETLLGGLSVEKVRWSEIASTLRIALDNVIGDVLLSSGFIAYLGSFPKQYRDDLSKTWIAKCFELEIPCTEDFQLPTTLSDSTEIRKWTTAKLPADDYTIESAIIVKNAHRYPLLIDPQGKNTFYFVCRMKIEFFDTFISEQANKWLRNVEKANGLRVIQYTDENYMDALADAISSGVSVLLENMRKKCSQRFHLSQK